MCCSFWEKYKNSPKTGLGCSTPLNDVKLEFSHKGGYMAVKRKKNDAHRKINQTF